LSEDKPLRFRVPVRLSPTVFPRLDVVFLVDVSDSFRDDIQTYKTVALDILSLLKESARDVQVGIATFSDFPLPGYGVSQDHAFRLLQPLTNDVASIVHAVDQLIANRRSGDDWPESQLEALYQLATGRGRMLGQGRWNPSPADIEPSRIGWRRGALPLIILATDARFHDADREPLYPGAGFEETIMALRGRGISIIGLDSGEASEDLTRLVRRTGGQIYALNAASEGIIEALAEAMGKVTSRVEVTLRPLGDEYGLVTSITPSSFSNLLPGETRTFTVTVRAPSPLRARLASKIRMRLEARGNDVALLGQYPLVLELTP
jgi:hypothetical protein